MLKPSEHLKKSVPVISEDLQRALILVGIGVFCGGIFGFVAGAIISGLVRAG